VTGFIDVEFMRDYWAAHPYHRLALIVALALAGVGWTVWHLRSRPGARGPAYALAALALVALSALGLRQNGTYCDAVQLYQHTLAKNPDCWLIHNNLGVLLADLAQREEASGNPQKAVEFRRQAIDHYEKTLQLNPDYSDAHTNLGNILGRVGRVQEAIPHCEEACRLMPKHPRLLNNLGYALARAGRFEEAIKKYQEALAIIPQEVKIRNNLAHAYIQLNQPEKAYQELQTSLKLMPYDSMLHYALGLTWAQRGQYQKARECYLLSIQLKSDCFDAYFDLAISCAALGNPPEAIAAAQTALKLAGSAGQKEAAQKIETWLSSYQAAHATP
jgi:tetratricopeptide (TPR) repeat protein